MEIIGVSLNTVLILLVMMLLPGVRRCHAARKDSVNMGDLYNELISFHKELVQQYDELKNTQDALRKSEERYKLAMAGANDGIWDYDVVRDELYLSERSGEILNLPAGVFGSMSKFLDLVVYTEDRECVDVMAREHFEGRAPYFICEHRLKSAPETWVLIRCKLLRDEAGKPVRLAGSHTDTTEVKKAQETVKFLAFHDSLTGLPNRAALSERVAIMAANCASGNSSGAFYFIDLDNFKAINDTFGHCCGDKMLGLVGERLSHIRGGKSFIARLGGDEFAVLMDHIKDRNEAIVYAEEMLRLFEKPLYIDNTAFYVTLSVGITLCPQDATSTEELFKTADLAMYSAKANGKNLYAFFNRAMDEQAKKRLLMERSLREALANNEFQLCYQPLFNIPDGRITGFESLIRWYNKDFGLVMPFDFIRLAEETGLIVPIGRWLLKTACDFVADLIRNGYDDLRISVNISVVELYQDDFVDAVQQIIALAGIPYSSIALEITESVLMESIDSNIHNLKEMRRSGVSIYLDDFGTGYSSLKYLKDLPIDVVKIDKSFIDYMDNEGVEKELTGAIIELAHRIGLKTVAEGVENQAQLKTLQEYHCDMCQGFLLSKPVREDQIYELLHKFR